MKEGGVGFWLLSHGKQKTMAQEVSSSVAFTHTLLHMWPAFCGCHSRHKTFMSGVSLSLCVCVCGAHFRKELSDVTGACINALHHSGLENLLQTHLRLEVRLTDRAFG